jgi:glycosyltransferase involved in cell wall biosynthesis
VNLLRLIHSLDPAAGGPVQGIHQLTPFLIERGVRTQVLSLDPADAPWLASTAREGFQPLGLGPGLGTYGYRRGLVDALMPHLATADVVVVHGLWQYHAFAAWRAWRRLGADRPPYWVYPHGMLDPWFRQAYPLKHLKKNLYWPWADYRLLRDAAGVCFTSEQERLLARQSFRLYQARELVVPYGIAPPPPDANRQRRAFLERFPELQHQQLIICMARLHEKKGLDLLVEAFAPLARANPRLQLMLAGPASGCDGAKVRQQLIALASRLGVAGQVHLPGLLQGDLKWGALRCAQLFALPSHQENFGVAVAEALACGLPVLISTRVNIAEEVLAAGAGFVQPDTAPATACALRDWNEMPKDQLAAMAAAATRLFEERFELGAGVDRLLSLWSATPVRNAVPTAVNR